MHLNPKDSLDDRWTTDCQQVFNTLVEKLTSAPILGYTNHHLPYLLHTDACATGLGGALCHEQQGHMRLIAYASRGLTKCEAKYLAHRLEFLLLNGQLPPNSMIMKSCH